MRNEVESASIPVLEEELKLDRRQVETGRVRVRTVPAEHTIMASDRLLRTTVTVERVALEEEIDDIPPVREEGEMLVVPIVEERLVKRLFLIEEVHLTRRASTEEIEQPVQLRSQCVIVERDQSSGDQHGRSE
jgi:stress response protein YsnF